MGEKCISGSSHVDHRSETVESQSILFFPLSLIELIFELFLLSISISIMIKISIKNLIHDPQGHIIQVLFKQGRVSEWVWVTINDQIWVSQIIPKHIYTLCPKTVWKISSQNWELNFHILRLDRIVGRHWIFIPWPAACPASYDLLPTWSEKA